MEPNTSNDKLQFAREPGSFLSRSILVVFCLVAGLGYRAIVGFFPAGILQAAILLALSAVLLVAAVLAKRSQALGKYWEIPLAFFIFTIAGIVGDQSGFIQNVFVRNVLRETPNANNPFASTVMGTVWAQLVSTACLVVAILLLTKASGADLKLIYVDKVRKLWPLIVGIGGFVLYYFYTASGRAQRFFPNNGVTHSRFLALTPALLVLVLCNGLKEELWFRGLFLKKYGRFLSPLSSNLLSAVIFASFHVQVTYTPALVPFLVIALVLGLLFGYLMQKSGSLLPSVIFHAGSDIPIFLVYLSYAVS